MDFLTAEELLLVLKTARQRSVRDWMMILMSFNHGLRASEVCNLKVDDIRDECVVVKRLKRSKQTVQALRPHKGEPLLDELRGLKLWMKQRPANCGSALFPSGKGGPLTRQSFFRLFQRYGRDAGLPRSKQHPHILKHTAANQMIRHGADLAFVQQRLGHAAIGSTMRYISVTDAEADAAAHNSLMDAFK